MAEEDVMIQWCIKGILYPSITIFLVYFFFRKQMKYLYLHVTAKLLTVAGKRSNKIFGEHKKDLFHSLKNLKTKVGGLKILEIGAGGGVNFMYYPSGTKVTCLDPNPCFESYIKGSSGECALVEMVGFVKAFAENMDMVEDCSYDVVVSTLVMCTVRDPDRVLQEIKRILKHNGKYYFLDHVAGEKNTIIHYIQQLINPVWMKFTGGCHLTRDTGASIKAAGFRSLDMKHFTAPTKMFLIRPCCMGIATK